MTRKIFLMAMGAVCAWFGGIASNIGMAAEKKGPEQKNSAEESSLKRKSLVAKAVGRSSINNY
ncbi:MAG: hypothetical protein HQK86_13400 [Nitrospinae bacterium]|nr:hypothetical protein [Nitrospinota bacterium]MBF0634818.1 hypothetical protein [Nitrospinota bacterium]